MPRRGGPPSGWPSPRTVVGAAVLAPLLAVAVAAEPRPESLWLDVHCEGCLAWGGPDAPDGRGLRGEDDWFVTEARPAAFRRLLAAAGVAPPPQPLLMFMVSGRTRSVDGTLQAEFVACTEKGPPADGPPKSEARRRLDALREVQARTCGQSWREAGAARMALATHRRELDDWRSERMLRDLGRRTPELGASR